MNSFNLNINNYSINELKLLIKLPEIYDFTIINKKIDEIKKKILDIKLQKKDNRIFFAFLNNIQSTLIIDFESANVKIKMNEMKNNYSRLVKEMVYFKGKELKEKRD
jgi:membrane-anchored protein YejM (alkaline phosphatase superfamily)